MKKISKLGIFDSGLGGYSVFQDLKHHFPDLSTVLYADQKNAPYGNYSKEEILHLAIQAMEWFKSKGISDILLACNTVSSVALTELIEHFPELRIWGIIDLTLSQLPSDVENVGVVATQATINSNSYPDKFKNLYNGTMISKALPDLAKSIEDLADTDEIDKQLVKGLEGMEACSHIILGCTHYPLALDEFEKLSTAKFLDSRKPIREFIRDNYIASDEGHRVITTKDADYLKHQIESLFHEIEDVEGV